MFSYYQLQLVATRLRTGEDNGWGQVWL